LEGLSFLLAWVLVWLVAAYVACKSWWGQTSGFLVTVSCALLASLGMLAAVNSVLRSSLLLSPSGLNLRSSFFGIATNKSINLSDVIDFGFGYPSHSRSAVLRLELRTPTVRTKWMELVRGVTGEDVKRFLPDIEAEGFRLPK
jgi:hypothetical protein